MRRTRIVFALVLGLSGLFAAPALADHCPPIDNPPPIPGQNTTYCHTPTPSPTPEPTPTPEATPTPETTPAPAPATQAPPAPQTTRAPTPFPIEVEEEPSGTPEVLVPGAVFDDIEEGTLEDTTEEAASGIQLTLVFLAGLIIGALLGRASWGLSKRRRRQQIFG